MTTATARITYNKVLKVLDFLPPDCPEELVTELVTAFADEKILFPKSSITINIAKTNK
jgi:Ca2+-binding EF-hand superfamily protein